MTDDELTLFCTGLLLLVIPDDWIAPPTHSRFDLLFLRSKDLSI